MSAPSLERFGLAVGHATDAEGATGCTVVRGVSTAHRAAGYVLGRATGTRDTALLEPGHSVERVDGILLAGGSAYGLDAAAGVMRWMEERGRGFSVGGGVVPIVPAAVIFDLHPLGRFDARPTPQMAYEACEAARSTDVAEGAVGAGTGATVGKLRGRAGAMKGGVGLAVAEGEGCAAAAIAVVNAYGDVRDSQGRIIAGARREDGAFVDTAQAIADGSPAGGFTAGTNTTICVVAVDRALPRIALQDVARSAGTGLLARITPAGTQSDGDVIFALAPMDGPVASPAQAEQLARQAMEQAIERAVRLAAGRDGVPGLATG